MGRAASGWRCGGAGGCAPGAGAKGGLKFLYVRARHRDAPVAATAALEATVERGNKAVQRLHAIGRNKCRDDPAVLAAWESASHVERRARTVAPPQPAPPPPST